MAELLQSHAGAHFTFALVELTVWRSGAADMIVMPNVLTRTVTIERGILRIEDGVAHVEALPPAQQAAKKPETLSDTMFFEQLAKIEAALPHAVRAFLAQIEPLGVYSDLRAALNIKVDLPELPKPINFGYIAKNGQLWTNPFAWTASKDIALRYNQRLANLVGAVVTLGNEINVTMNGKSAPKVAALLPEHAEAWAAAIEEAIAALRAQENSASA